jgi:hypothetical protein
MAGQPKAPILIKPIPNFITNEGAAFGPLDLKQFIHSVQETNGVLRFSAQLTDGSALPAGLICTSDGLLSGIAKAGTAGVYSIQLTVENDADVPLITPFQFTIKERMGVDDPRFLTDLKTQIWQALGQNIPVPEIADLMQRPISLAEMCYLMERFAYITVWDAFTLEPPGDKIAITLEGASRHYHVFDRGSCIVGAPKDLFSHERTLEDALQTARAIAREVYQRGWTIELGGYHKMTRAAWIELQHLGDKNKNYIEILHYTPTPKEVQLYAIQAEAQGRVPGM